MRGREIRTAVGDDEEQEEQGQEATQEEQEEAQVETPTVADIRDIVDERFLKAIATASGRFSFIVDQNLGPGDPMGFTDMNTKSIHLNPHYIRDMSRESIEGLLSHEAGHHAPPVVELHSKMVAGLAKESTVPDDIAETPKQKAEVARAIFSHLCNVELDCWLESYMGRGRHRRTRNSFEKLYEGATGEGRDSIREAPLPEQLGQILVGEDRYPPGMPDSERMKLIESMVDSRVFAKYKELKMRSKPRVPSAVETLNNAAVFNAALASEGQKHRAVHRKMLAHEQAFLPAYLDLYRTELEDREQKKKEQGEGQGEDGEQELTSEQIEELMKQLSDELEELGKKYKSQTPAEGESEDKKGKKIIQDISKGGEAAKPKQSDSIDGKKDRSKTAQQAMREFEKSANKGMAESSGVDIGSVEAWRHIKEVRKHEIDFVAEKVSEVFLADRRKWMEYGRREGEITPGMEFEHISGVLSGDPTPKTHMRYEQHPDFLETEIEFVVDVSGSMNGDPIQKCKELVVILSEGFRKARLTLESEGLLDPRDEQPLRIGVVKFDTQATRVKKLGEPMTDEAEMQIVHELSKGGGGTDEKEVLETVYGEMATSESNVLKIMEVLTDGYGNKEAVQQIMQQAEDDNEVVVAVTGLGSGAKAVIDTYTSGLRRGEDSNIHAFEAEDPSNILEDHLDFIVKEVMKRRKYN